MASTIHQLVSLFVISITASTGFACPDKWTYYPGDGTCLRIFGQYDYSKVLSWNKSREACEQYGGDLVEITDEEKNSFVYKLIAGSSFAPWIGMRNHAKYGFDFKYVDGSPINTYHPWIARHPMGDDNEVKCVVMTTWRERAGQWKVSKCSGTQPYVCSTPSNGTDTTVTTVTQETTTVALSWNGDCPVRWRHYEGDHTCLRIFAKYDYTKVLTWNKSREDCQKYGGDLVEIRDEAKNDFVYKLVARARLSPWIGIRNHAKYGFDFRYVDGSAIGPYRPWYRVSPYGDYNNDIKCVLMSTSKTLAGNWSVITCSGTQPYVCSLPSRATGTTVAPSVTKVCPDNQWTYYKGDNTCLRVFAKYHHANALNWNNSREDCQKYGGDLVQIKDEEKNTFVHKLVDTKNISPWIGISNVAKVGNDFEYVNGSKLASYHPWLPVNPFGNGKEDVKCVIMSTWIYHEAKWSVVNCLYRQPYVCSIPSLVSDDV